MKAGRAQVWATGHIRNLVTAVLTKLEMDTEASFHFGIYPRSTVDKVSPLLSIVTEVAKSIPGAKVGVLTLLRHKEGPSRHNGGDRSLDAQLDTVRLVGDNDDDLPVIVIDDVGGFRAESAMARALDGRCGSGGADRLAHETDQGSPSTCSADCAVLGARMTRETDCLGRGVLSEALVPVRCAIGADPPGATGVRRDECRRKLLVTES